jgi:hypothetical protein
LNLQYTPAAIKKNAQNGSRVGGAGQRPLRFQVYDGWQWARLPGILQPDGCQAASAWNIRGLEFGEIASSGTDAALSEVDGGVDFGG